MHRLRTVKFESGRAAGRIQADLEFQTAILPGVSRTFALTIPILPDGLAEVVANAYLLCRLADTIEDDVGLDHAAKTAFHNRLVAVVQGDADADAFAKDLAPLLSDRVLPAERELVAHAATVVRITQSFSPYDRRSIARCLGRMCAGMPDFQRHKSLGGLSDLNEMNAYCYVVAGVVGEMLTELFCERCPTLAGKRSELMPLALSFGQGLQMTNILKDIWEDRRAETCWLPRSVFGADFDLSRLDELHTTAEYRRGLEHLIGIAHHHLRNALEYTRRIPPREAGIRRFCLWAIGLAVLTLRKVRKHGTTGTAERLKISRRSVRLTVGLVNLTHSNDRALRALFDAAAAGLPLVHAETDLLDGRQPDASRA